MERPWADWDHVVKVDPDKDLQPGETFADVCETGTDAIMVGGTTGVTPTKIRDVIDQCTGHDVPVFIEPNTPTSAITADRLGGHFVPTVLNAGDVSWLIGFHKEWVRLTADIDWARTFLEGYIVLNPASSVATVTEANCDQRPADVAAYATVAEQLFGLPIVYIEYSGTYGDPEIVARTAEAVENASLFYGGGIHDYDSARRMARHADVVIVGNLLHADGVAAVAETVQGAADAAPASRRD